MNQQEYDIEIIIRKRGGHGRPAFHWRRGNLITGLLKAEEFVETKVRPITRQRSLEDIFGSAVYDQEFGKA